MNRWVLDGSFAGALFLPEERSARVAAFFSGLSEEYQFLVPALWWYELANVLTVASRRRLLTRAEVLKVTELFSRFPIETDTDFGPSFTARVSDLASSFGLSAYDATYLDLAMRHNAVLATLDKDLIDAAAKAGVGTVGH